MDLKLRLQRMLQLVEEAERVGALADIERDILLGELREAYAELKFGITENEKQKTENDVFSVAPTTPVTPIDEEQDDDEQQKPEVEVELVFNESEEDDEEPVVEPAVVETPNAPTTHKRSVLLSLYEDNPTPVLGEQFHDAPSVADTIACPKGVAESTPVVSLREAIGVADKFMLIRELFGGDADAYDKALDALEVQPSLDDCRIYIAEHYAWSLNSQATKFVMELLQRKYN